MTYIGIFKNRKMRLGQDSVWLEKQTAHSVQSEKNGVFHSQTSVFWTTKWFQPILKRRSGYPSSSCPLPVWQLCFMLCLSPYVLWFQQFNPLVMYWTCVYVGYVVGIEVLKVNKKPLGCSPFSRGNTHSTPNDSNVMVIRRIRAHGMMERVQHWVILLKSTAVTINICHTLEFTSILLSFILYSLQPCAAGLVI